MPRKIFENHTELPYHVTARCINRDWFSLEMPLVWKIMCLHLHFTHLAFNIRVHSFVLMSNHFHMIVRTPEGNLSQAMQFFMRETSRDITQLSSRINQTYGSRFHRSLLGSPQYYLHAYKYVYRNPVEAGLCQKVEEYPYSTIQALLGNSRVEIPVLDDWNWGNLLAREETLKWLNEKPPKESWEEVRVALKKPVFKLRKKDSRLSPLEDTAL
ncbi:transposase [Bdellovibrio sp. BCCA]|uniref:transposase n=1 Tax=Bdellovibrio sp. BCCA TaxID=3136281 RepID=UPI0030F32181